MDYQLYTIKRICVTIIIVVPGTPRHIMQMLNTSCTVCIDFHHWLDWWPWTISYQLSSVCVIIVSGTCCTVSKCILCINTALYTFTNDPRVFTMVAEVLAHGRSTTVKEAVLCSVTDEVWEMNESFSNAKIAIANSKGVWRIENII